MRKLVFVSLLTSAFLINPNAISAASMFDITGYIDGLYTAVNDQEPQENNKFEGKGEIDFNSVTMEGRVTGLLDLNYFVENNGNGGSPEVGNFFLDNFNHKTIQVEQALARVNVVDGLNLDVGQFNSDLSWEGQDPVDLYQTTHGQLFNFYDQQTKLYGNDVLGAALNADLSKVVVRVAVLNDIGEAKDAQSLMAMVKGEVINGLQLEGSVITQRYQAPNPLVEGSVGQVGNIYDVNGQYTFGPLLVEAEFMKPEKTVKYGWSSTVHYRLFGEHYGLTGRVDRIRFNPELDRHETTSYTVAGVWRPKENFDVFLEYRAYNDGRVNHSLTLEALAMFL